MSEPATPMKKEKPFFNKRGFGSEKLRLKDGEELEKGVLRLRKDGWEIPDLSALQVGTDQVGKYVELK